MAKNKRAQEVWHLYQQANNGTRKKWIELQQKGYDFYLNDQLTSTERSALQNAGMPTFIINRILPIIEVMLYFVTAKNPRWKVVGVEGSDSDMAEVHSQIADRGWYISGGQKLFSQVIRDALTKSIGYFFVDIDRDADRGRGEVKVYSLDPWDVLIAEQTTDFCIEDAPYVLINKIFTKSQLINVLPQYKQQIMKASGEVESRDYSQRDYDESESIQHIDLGSVATDSKGKEEQLVNYFMLYEKVRVPYVHVYMVVKPTEEELAQAMQVVDIQMREFEKELDVQKEEKIEQISKALENNEIIPERAELELERAEKMRKQALVERRQLMESKARDSVTTNIDKILTKEEFDVLYNNDPVFKENIVDYAEYFETRIRKTCTVGEDQFLYEEIDQALDEYPISPLPYLWTGTPYPMSACTPLIGKQQEINKAHQIMIHNASLGSSLRYKYVEGQINEEDWEENASTPGGLLKYNPMFPGDTGPIEVLPKDLNNAFFTITQQGEKDMEYISGIQSQLMGFTQDAPETYRGLLANDEYGTRRIRQWISNIVEPSLEKVGRLYMKLAQQHYTVHKVFRMVQPNANDDMQTNETEINIPIYNDLGEQIGKFKDYNAANFDLRVIPGSTLPLNRWALLEEYFRWFQAGILDDIAFIAETDIRNKEQLVQRKSLIAQMQQAIEQFKEQVKSLDGDKQTLMRQIMQLEIKLGTTENLLEIRKGVQDTKAGLGALEVIAKSKVDQEKELMKKDAEIIKEKIRSKEGNSGRTTSDNSK